MTWSAWQQENGTYVCPLSVPAPVPRDATKRYAVRVVGSKTLGTTAVACAIRKLSLQYVLAPITPEKVLAAIESRRD